MESQHDQQPFGRGPCPEFAASAPSVNSGRPLWHESLDPFATIESLDSI